MKLKSIEIRTIIAKHLALRNKLQIAAKVILENGDSILDVATKYGLEYHILYRKINIMKRKEEFYDLKRKLDAARKDLIDGKSTNKAIAKNYGINVSTLYHEVKRARAQESYECDRKISNGTDFTYLQEESLLNILKNWARRKSLKNRCSCLLCALEKLLTLAYEFAQKCNIKCPSWDIDRQASIDWLIDFEMRRSDEISNSFDSFVNPFEQNSCLKQTYAGD